MKVTRKKLLIGLLALVLVTIALVVLWLVFLADEQTGGRLTLYGNVDIREVDLAFAAQERIVSLTAEEGDTVHSDQVLGRLDQQKLRRRLDRQQAEVDAQSEMVAKLRAGSRPQEIDKAKANLQLAQARLENAQTTYRRIEELARKDIMTQQQKDDALAQLKVARESVKAAEEEVDLLLAGPREEEIRAAAAKLRALEAAVALTRQQLKDTTLRCPVDGVIRNKILETGEMASPQTPAYTIALTDPVWVRAYVPETDLGRIQPGMQAFVKTDTYPHKRYAGTIGFISPTAEFTPKTIQTPEIRTNLVYQVRINVPNPESELRLGMPATVIIPLDDTEVHSNENSHGAP